MLAVVAVLLAMLLPGSAGAVWTTNSVTLDDGTCGHNLQVGSDDTASGSATPSFFVRGDGGLSSYAMAVDGRAIGTFASAGNGIVCVTVAAALEDGAHVLTGTELAPHAGWAVASMQFSVDTVAPAPPSAPALSDYRDSGIVGDGVTSFRSLNVNGTTRPNQAVQILSGGVSIVGGARSDGNGRWSVSTLTLADGAYTLTAIALDSAGNRSAPSTSARIRIDSVAPATPGRPTLIAAGTDAGGPLVGGTAPRDVTTVRVFADGVQIGVATPTRTHAWRFAVPELAPGAHAIAVTAADAADNTTPLSAAVDVTFPASGPPSDPPGLDPAPSAPDAGARPTAPPQPVAPAAPRPSRPVRG